MIYLGLDLGQATDYTALSALEKVFQRQANNEYGQPVFVAEHHIRHLRRFALGTSYVSVARQLALMTQAPELRDYLIVADATGVGRPVVDMLRSYHLRVMPVVITSGDTESFVDGYWHVAKKVLVSNLVVLLGEKRLKLAKEIEERDTVINELRNFRVKTTRSANETYEAWRDQDHDDLVLSIAIASWYAERFGQQRQKPRVERNPLLEPVMRKLL